MRDHSALWQKIERSIEKLQQHPRDLTMYYADSSSVRPSARPAVQDK